VPQAVANFGIGTLALATQHTMACAPAQGPVAIDRVS